MFAKSWESVSKMVSMEAMSGKYATIVRGFTESDITELIRLIPSQTVSELSKSAPDAVLHSGILVTSH